jgi:hypothetical protein
MTLDTMQLGHGRSAQPPVSATGIPAATVSLPTAWRARRGGRAGLPSARRLGPAGASTLTHPPRGSRTRQEATYGNDRARSRA